jgi:hypothetical protein
MPRLFLSIVLVTSLAAVPCRSAQGDRLVARGQNDVSFTFDTKEDGDGNPHTKVFLVVGARRELLAEATANFSLLERKDYKDHGVPADALTACSGWWAGQGQDLYVVRRNGRLVVYSRSLDEQARTPPYKRLKVITSP